MTVTPGEAVFGAALNWGQDTQPIAGAVKVPGAATCQVLVEGEGLVLLNYPDVADARVGQVRQGYIDDAVDTRKGDGGLGAVVGERG